MKNLARPAKDAVFCCFHTYIRWTHQQDCAKMNKFPLENVSGARQWKLVSTKLIKDDVFIKLKCVARWNFSAKI